jgi:hypothetical protein
MEFYIVQIPQSVAEYGTAEEDMGAIDNAIKLADEYGLRLEVLRSAMHILQRNLGASISQALDAGLTEWDV